MSKSSIIASTDFELADPSVAVSTNIAKMEVTSSGNVAIVMHHGRA